MHSLVALVPLVFAVSLGAPWPAQQSLVIHTPAPDPAHLLQRLHTLHLLSAGLIEQAGTGRAPANDFQIQARLYREQLRQTMLANRELAPAQQLPQDLLLGMVRMSAMLHAAADCKSGLYISCPPDLLRQLRAQQNSVGDILSTFAVPGADPS